MPSIFDFWREKSVDETIDAVGFKKTAIDEVLDVLEHKFADKELLELIGRIKKDPKKVKLTEVCPQLDRIYAKATEEKHPELEKLERVIDWLRHNIREEIKKALQEGRQTLEVFDATDPAPLVIQNIDGPKSNYEHQLQSYFANFFRNAPEHKVMADILLNPSVDPEQIQKRQKIIEALIASGSIDDLVELKTEAAKLVEGCGNLLGSGFYDVRREARAINLFHRGKKYLIGDEWVDKKDERIPLGPIIKKGFTNLRAGFESFDKLIAALQEIQDPALQPLIADMKKLLDDVTFFMKPENFTSAEAKNHAKEDTHEEYDQEDDGYWGPVSSFNWRRLKPALEKLGAVLEFAQVIRNEGWAKLSFDADRPEYYKNGKYFESSFRPYDHKEQVPCDSLPDNDVVVISGVNSSGKSKTLKRDLFIHLAAQSLGYAPCTEGNVRIYDSFGFVDRASTDHDNNLSAYMSELKDLETAFAELTGRSRLYIDEGFSTTSHDDQVDMLGGVALHARENGGSVVFANHSEQFTHIAEETLGAAVVHLETSLDEKGNLIRHFRIAPGADDSRALEVARMKNFSPGVLDLTSRFLAGERPELKVETAQTFPEVGEYTAEDREAMKKLTVSAQTFFPKSPANDARLKLFSEDQSFTPGGFMSAYATGDYYQFNEFEHPLQYIGKMVLFAGELTSQQILERQKMFAFLAGDKRYDEIKEHISNLVGIEAVYGELAELDRGVGVNRALNPFIKKEKPKATGGLSGLLDDDLDDEEVELDDDEPLDENDEDPDFGSMSEDEFDAWLENRDAKRRDRRRNRKEKKEVKEKPRTYEVEDIKKAIAFINLNKKLLGIPADFFPEMLVEGLTALAEAPIKNFHGDEQVQGEAKRLAEELNALIEKLPKVKFADFDIALIEPELKILASEEGDEEEEKKRPKKEKPKRGDVFTTILKVVGGTARTLLSYPDFSQRSNRLIEILRSSDSVYLHQAANGLEAMYKHLAATGKINKAEIFGQPEAAKAASLSHLGRERTSPFDYMFGPTEEKNPYNKELQALEALATFGQIIDTQGLTPAVLNNTGTTELRECFSLVDKKEGRVANDILIGGKHGSTQLLTGPNGSGKTHFLKSLTAATLTGLATGFVPATKGTLPMYGKVIYMDRVLEKSHSGLSAFTNELTYWNELFDITSSNKPALVCVDEGWSTTSPRYSGALSCGAVGTVMQQGQTMLYATHDHKAVDTMVTASGDDIKPYHFGYKLTGKEGIKYTFKLQQGHAGSFALPVAKSRGFQPGIIEKAEKFKASRN